MIENRVEEAYVQLLSDLRALAVAVGAAGSEALVAGDLDMAELALDLAKALDDSRHDLEGMRERLKLVGAGPKSRVAPPILRTQRPSRRAGTDIRAFRVPILQELVARGGAGEAEDVLAAVHQRMGDMLTSDDNEPLAFHRLPRWRATATRARQILTEEGLMTAGSADGQWQISEAGRWWLEAMEKGR